MAARIEDYALIGDCHTAALVSSDGSIDWLCFPRFDSPACFAALVGTPENGCWRIAPAAEVRTVRRRYRGDTLILETDFEADHGAVTLIDFMPIQSGTSDVVRLVQGRRGTKQSLANLGHSSLHSIQNFHAHANDCRPLPVKRAIRGLVDR